MTLRRRFLLATALLLAVHLATTSLVLWSWTRALASSQRQQGLLEARVEVAALGSAVREQYVHQAHTYIEGGVGHLHHGGEVADNVRQRTDRLAALPEVHPGWVSLIRADQQALADWFDQQVVPLAQAGTLDRPTADRLHATTEGLTLGATARLDALSAALDQAQAEERARSARAVSFAGLATLGFLLVGLGALVFIGRSLADAVLTPVDALRQAAAHWQPGASHRGRRSGDSEDSRDSGKSGASGASGAPGDSSPSGEADELGEIAAAFDLVVERLAQAEARRVESARLAALGEMSAVVAHELLNPLTVVLASVSELDPAAVPAAVPIRQEVEHARRIVQGLLGFARPTEQPATEVDVVALAREAVDRMVPTADLAEVAIRFSGPERVQLIASPSAVRQVLDNLVRNAVQASPPGGEVEVEVFTDRVEVRDRGPGLPPEVRSRLYEPFVTGRATGTGLGLAVSDRIARALGGALRHDDREGGGTVATFRWGREP